MRHCCSGLVPAQHLSSPPSLSTLPFCWRALHGTCTGLSPCAGQSGLQTALGQLVQNMPQSENQSSRTTPATACSLQDILWAADVPREALLSQGELAHVGLAFLVGCSIDTESAGTRSCFSDNLNAEFHMMEAAVLHQMKLISCLDGAEQPLKLRCLILDRSHLVGD